MTETVRIAVPRKGRPLEAVLQRLSRGAGVEDLADEITSTLRYEKSITKGRADPERDVYERLADYSTLSDPTAPEYTLYRDDREGMPRRIVFDSVTVSADGVRLQLVGREEPFRALRTHSFALGFDSADLVLEEVVELRAGGLDDIQDVNDRIDPKDTDVRVVSSLGDTVYHTLLATPETLPPDASLDREFLANYEGRLCISPRYERLVGAVLGTSVLEDIEFTHPDPAETEEEAIARTGAGVYLTVTGSTAREHGLVVGEHLFPSETVLMENRVEADAAVERAATILTAESRDATIEV